MICNNTNCKNFDPVFPDPEQEAKEDLSIIMKQHFAILNCLLELASVAGDLYILEKPNRQEMSPELFMMLEDLTKRLKEFNDAFCFEF